MPAKPENRVFLPRRITKILRGIYQNRISVVCAPDGTGKSTLLREFARRSRPEGVSVRFIRSAKSSGECFAQICQMITGEALSEPLTDREMTLLRAKFTAAGSENPLMIFVDCDAACQTLLGNFRTAKLLSECTCARFTFVCTALKPGYRMLAESMKFFIIEREQICMNLSEISELTARTGTNVSPADIYAASGGNFLNAHLCLILAQKGKEFMTLTTEGRIIHALFGSSSKPTADSLRLQGALIAAATYPIQSEAFCCDLRSFRTISDYFGGEVFTPENILHETERLNTMIPLIEINRRSREVKIHPLLMHAAYTLFFNYPEDVRHDLRICFAKEYIRRGQYFFSFCEYFLAGEFELAAGVRGRDTISYSLLNRSTRLLYRFVEACPMDCKPIIPLLLRITALLMHTDAKPMLAGKFSWIVEHISSSENYDASERKLLTSYAFALQTNENFYVLDKMGSSIKRAYDLYKSGCRYDSPKFPWTLYAPSVFCLLHRRGYSLQTENDQFVRYQHMYTEMLGHGRYAQIVFTGEMKYYQGDLESALELLSTAVLRCSGEENTAMKLSALFAASKCCLYLGYYKKYFDFLKQIHEVERSHIGREEGDCARLCLGILRTMRGGSIDDMWFALTAESTDAIYNRYTAPYFSMVQAACLLMLENYETLTSNCESFISIAEAAGNEAAGIKLRLYGAQAFLSLGNHETAIRLFCEALDLARENFTPIVPAEFYAMYPDIFGQLSSLVSERIRMQADRAAELGARLQRGVEAVRTYEITYLFNTSADNYAEHYLAPLDRLMRSTDELRISLGLTKPAYAYAIMAASGVSNPELSILFNASLDSIKSSLKRTCAALGAKNRRELIGKIPTLK